MPCSPATFRQPYLPERSLGDAIMWHAQALLFSMIITCCVLPPIVG